MERAKAEAILDGDRETAVALLMRVGELVEANRRLEARVTELEEGLNRSSRNSSLPPSQDPPSAPPRPKKPASGRRPGGQPGHEGTNRPLLRLERVDEVRDHWPERCGRCAHAFGADERVEVASVQRHQLVELPPITVRVTEHRLHRVGCPRCGREARAELPAEVPRGAFGPRLEAAVATLSVRNRVSRRDTVELIGELFGCRLATGTIDAIVKRAGEALAEPYARLADHVRSASAVNVDETGWRLRGGKRTLWAALGERAALFRIAPDRHEREAKALLGEGFEGVTCSDRWWAYNYLEPERRQVCWSHLIRDFTAQGEGLEPEKSFGQAGLEIARRLFSAWDDFQRDGDRARLIGRVAPLKRELKPLLERCAGKSPKYKRTRGLARNLLKVWPALWTFTKVEGVEPTNNRAERGLRGAVIYRKLSLGSQSEAGERTIERLLSASQTCRLQRRSLFAYLADVLAAKTRGDPLPALI
jgi:transposase